jgi:hypothetical protein
MVQVMCPQVASDIKWKIKLRAVRVGQLSTYSCQATPVTEFYYVSV